LIAVSGCTVPAKNAGVFSTAKIATGRGPLRGIGRDTLPLVADPHRAG
jgi:hypothetical protein